MKIGILTYHFSNNYGAVLQTYALQEKLRQLGHSTIIINRTPIKNDIFHKLYQFINSNSSFFWNRFRKFSKEYLLPITRPFYSDEQLRKGIPDYDLDAIIVGSDQIWRGTMCGHSYFLTFLPENSSILRISYAASFGKSEWDKTRGDTSLVKEALNRFNNISVRENTGVYICNDVFGIEAKLTIDPTLLHDAEFYEQKIIGDHKKVTSLKVVSYILGKSAIEMVKAANQYAQSVGLIHSELYYLDKDLRGMNLSNIESHKKHITVDEWLKEIRDADYVITNSFHCVVFSIIFKKNFVVLKYESGGNDRLITLLTSIKLENRIVSSANKIKEVLSENINYELYFDRISKLRDDSVSFLLNSFVNK